MIRRPPRSTQSRSSAASDVYKRQDQTQEVKSSVVLLYVPACTNKGGIGVEASVGDGRRDAYQILRHDASGAEIQVSDLAVAHLSFRQTDAKSGSFKQRA